MVVGLTARTDLFIRAAAILTSFELLLLLVCGSLLPRLVAYDCDGTQITARAGRLTAVFCRMGPPLLSVWLDCQYNAHKQPMLLFAVNMGCQLGCQLREIQLATDSCTRR